MRRPRLSTARRGHRRRRGCGNAPRPRRAEGVRRPARRTRSSSAPSRGVRRADRRRSSSSRPAGGWTRRADSSERVAGVASDSRRRGRGRRRPGRPRSRRARRSRRGVEIVLVHDAARALTPAESVRRGRRGRRAGARHDPRARPSIDTIKRVERRRLVLETVDRCELVAVQTPQGFRAAASSTPPTPGRDRRIHR